MEKVDLYKNYTSTSVLYHGDEKKKTKWSKKYFKKYILSHLPSDKESEILEIGCGYGRYTLAMKNAGYSNITAIDISQEQVDYAIHKLGLNNVHVADALNFIEISEKKYHCIIVMDVLEHLEIDYCISLLQAVEKHLHREGCVIIHVPNGLAPFKPAFHSDITHIRAFSPISMAQALRMAGFSQYKHYQLAPLPHSPISIIRNLLWNIFFKQIIKMYMIISYGSSCGGIYTDNLLTVARKK